MSGDWAGYRECHIKPDLLLIYSKALSSNKQVRPLPYSRGSEPVSEPRASASGLLDRQGYFVTAPKCFPRGFPLKNLQAVYQLGIERNNNVSESIVNTVGLHFHFCLHALGDWLVGF